MSAEVTNADITNARTDHISRINGMDGNLVTHHGKLQLILDTQTHHTQFHFRSLRTAQALHNLFLRHLHARYR